MTKQFAGFGPLFSPDDGKGGGGGGEGGDGKGAGGDSEKGKGGGKPPANFAEWLKDQPEEVKSLYAEDTKGLRTALEQERDGRKDLEKQLRDLAKKAEKGSELEQQLTKQADAMAEADRKADFYEAAHAAGVSNLKLAYVIAVQEELFDRRGRVNFDELKKAYPELFGAAKPAAGKGHAGAGTGSGDKGAGGMNEMIRRAAGRG